MATTPGCAGRFCFSTMQKGHESSRNMRHQGTLRRVTQRARRSGDLVMVFSLFARASRAASILHGVSTLRSLEHRQESAPQIAIGGRSKAARIFFRVPSRSRRANTFALLESPLGPKSDRRPVLEPPEQQPSCQRHLLHWWSRSNVPSTAPAVRQM